MAAAASLRILADENMHPSVVAGLRRRGMDVVRVQDLGLRGQPDDVVLGRAAEEARAVLTQDTDFGRLAIATGAPCAGVILVRPGDLLPTEVLALLDAWLQHADDLPEPFVVVLEPGTTRTRALT